MPKPSVSIALATYNGSAYLAQQLASLAAQTVLPDELVVSDDGSTDDTIGVIERFAATAPFRVTLLPAHERLGFSDNFLHAAEHCTGDLIAFCDQDDEWLPVKLERQIERIGQDHSLMALHTLIVADGDLQPTGSIWMQDIAGDAVVEALHLNPYRTGWGNSMLFDRRLLRLVDRRERPRQPEEARLPLSHDTWVLTLACALGRVSHMAEPLLRYRQHGANTYGVGPMPWRIRIGVALRFHRTRFAEEMAFDDHLARLFAGIRDADFHAAAERAAAVYAERASLCRDRLATYGAPTMGERFGAFRRARRRADYAPSPVSSLKELLLGASGASRHAAFMAD